MVNSDSGKFFCSQRLLAVGAVIAQTKSFVELTARIRTIRNFANENATYFL